jgi:hypothetical protein
MLLYNNVAELRQLFDCAPWGASRGVPVAGQIQKGGPIGAAKLRKNE